VVFRHKEGRIEAIAEDSEEVCGYISYTQKETTVTIEHTVVDSKFRGQGIAGKLMEEACRHFQDEGSKIIPVCSYAVQWFEKNPQMQFMLEP